MVSPYLERRLRSYREALREIRKRHTVRRARKAKDRESASESTRLRLISRGAESDRPKLPCEDA